MSELAAILLDILAPVFLVVAAGFLVADRLELDPRTPSRLAYWLLGPVFIFQALIRLDLAANVVLRMVAVAVAAMLVTGLLVMALGRGAGVDRGRLGAVLHPSTHGNVGNFGLAICAFALGADALPLAGVVFVAINTVGIVVGVAAAGARTGSSWAAVRRAITAPMTLVVPPAIAIRASGISLPLAVERSVDLLAAALIPLMLLTLGIQMRQMRRPRLGRAMAIPLAAKLVAAPLAAAGLAAALRLSNPPAAVVILQSAMPAAVFTSVIAIEHDSEADLVTAIVLIGTLLSAVTLPAVIALVG